MHNSRQRIVPSAKRIIWTIVHMLTKIRFYTLWYRWCKNYDINRIRYCLSFLLILRSSTFICTEFEFLAYQILPKYGDSKLGTLNRLSNSTAYSSRGIYKLLKQVLSKRLASKAITFKHPMQDTPWKAITHVDYSDVVGAMLVGDAPTSFSF